MRECYLLLAVVGLMMLHGMLEQSALMDGDALKQDEAQLDEATPSNTNQANQHALILAQGLKQ